MNKIAALSHAETSDAMASAAILVHRKLRELQAMGQRSRQRLAFAPGNLVAYLRPVVQRKLSQAHEATL